jgi:hypothetical protein
MQGAQPVTIEAPSTKSFVACAAARISRTLAVLERQENLSPSNQTVNRLLSNLVQFCSSAVPARIQAAILAVLEKGSKVERLRALCQRAETKLEHFYGYKIVQARSPGHACVRCAWSQLCSFPYFTNYLELSLLEWKLLGRPLSGNFVFIGSGALPLSAISLSLIMRAAQLSKLKVLRQLAKGGPKECSAGEAGCLLKILENSPTPRNFKIMALDRDQKACLISQKLIKTLDLEASIQILHLDGAAWRPAKNTAGVIVASMTADKHKLLCNLSARLGQRTRVKILVRGAERAGLRQLFYEPVERLLTSLLRSCDNLKHVGFFHPQPGERVLNSVEVLQLGA